MWRRSQPACVSSLSLFVLLPHVPSDTMVTFTCADCGDSLRKNAVDKHSVRCRFTVITCIDCFQEFTYVMNTHVTRLTIRYPTLVSDCMLVQAVLLFCSHAVSDRESAVPGKAVHRKGRREQGTEETRQLVAGEDCHAEQGAAFSRRSLFCLIEQECEYASIRCTHISMQLPCTHSSVGLYDRLSARSRTLRIT